MRQAVDRRPRARQRLLLAAQEFQPLLHALAGVELADAGGDHPLDLRRRELSSRRQDPLALLVELADDPRSDRLVPVVELLLQLVLDDRALLLDDEHLFEPTRELADPLPLQRPDHADLVDPHTDLGGVRLVDAEILQRLQDIEIGLAGGDDAEAGEGAVEDDAVEPVGARERQRRVDLVPLQPKLLLQRLVRPADA